jgi:hypothetical protein
MQPIYNDRYKRVYIIKDQTDAIMFAFFFKGSIKQIGKLYQVIL